jgi:hypothetical protein
MFFIFGKKEDSLVSVSSNEGIPQMMILIAFEIFFNDKLDAINSCKYVTCITTLEEKLHQHIFSFGCNPQHFGVVRM